MQHLNGRHESTHADTIVLRSANFLGLVEHGVEFSDLVAVANSFKELLNAGSVAWCLEV